MNKVGVIGWPVEQSLSPAMHNAAFAALGMADWYYDRIAVPPDIVRLSLRELRDHGYIGLNVTVPHKQAVMPFVKADAIARVVGAVNTIDFRTNEGTNSDVAGFMDDLAAHDIDVYGQRALVLGAGGAARAAVFGLVQAGAEVLVVNRTLERAQNLALDLGGGVRALLFEQVVDEPVALIVNCTSVGMWPRIHESPWPHELPLPKGAIVYDMIYRPAKTQLMRQAEAAGLRAIGGLGMLARQGAVAFERWTGVRAPLDVMIDALRTELNKLNGDGS
ncbi:MAG: shikimate dehydrogenase [Aggregatilineales bacterium]